MSAPTPDRYDPQSPHFVSARSERAQMRERLSRAVNNLADQASLQVQMQKDPIKMLGGASGVGLVLGLLIGSRLRRTRRVYVNADSSKKEQKALAKAQVRAAKKGGGIGNALMGLIVTVGFKVLQDRVLTPQLEKLADNLMERADQREQGTTKVIEVREVREVPR